MSLATLYLLTDDLVTYKKLVDQERLITVVSAIHVQIIQSQMLLKLHVSMQHASLTPEFFLLEVVNSVEQTIEQAGTKRDA